MPPITMRDGSMCRSVSISHANAICIDEQRTTQHTRRSANSRKIRVVDATRCAVRFFRADRDHISFTDFVKSHAVS